MLYYGYMAANAYHLHFHARRRAKKKPKTLIDILVYFAVIFGPLMTLPQVVAVWHDGAKGVSAATWLAYTLVAVIWLAYGLKHQDRPIIALQTLWLIMDVAVVTGVLIA